jgi:hypothetical protein
MSGYKGLCICYLAYLCSARWLVFGHFLDELRGTPSRNSLKRGAGNAANLDLAGIPSMCPVK